MSKKTVSGDSLLIDQLAGGTAALTVGETRRALTRGAHRHPHGVLFLLRSGYVKSEAATGRWIIPAGHLCWVPPFAVHRAEMVGARGIRINLAANLCAGLPDTPSVMAVTPLILAIFDRLAVSTKVRKSLSASEARLLGVLYDEIERAKTTPIVLPMPKHGPLSRSAEKWLRHPDDRRDLDELASDAGMSRRTFTRLFRRDTGLSIGRWRQIARLMRGIELLAAGKSVTEVTFALGYDSMSSFFVLCKQHTGMSPKLLARRVAGNGGHDT